VPIKKVDFSYPIQKLGTKIHIKLTDENGYDWAGTFTIKNKPIKLKVKSVKYGHRNVTGTTAPKAKVTATIGKKTYRATANKNGKFSIKIPIQKAKKKINVTAKDSYGYYKSKTLKVKYVYSSVIINNTVYENTRTLDIIAKNVVKGEKIQVKKVKKDAKSYNIKLNIGSHGAGSNIIVTLYVLFDSWGMWQTIRRTGNSED